MRIPMVLGLIFASLFSWMAVSLAASTDWDIAKVIGAIVFGYLALVQFALLFVARWAKEMAA